MNLDIYKPLAYPKLEPPVMLLLLQSHQKGQHGRTSTGVGWCQKLQLGPCLLLIAVISPGAVVGVGWVRTLLLLLLDPCLLLLQPVVFSPPPCAAIGVGWFMLLLLLLAGCLLVAAVPGATLFIFLLSPGDNAFLLLLVGFLVTTFPPSVAAAFFFVVVAAAVHIACPHLLPHGSLSTLSSSIGVFLLHCHPNSSPPIVPHPFVCLSFCCCCFLPKSICIVQR